MTDINILTFQESINKAKTNRHLLLGNGFSIALKRNIFNYGSLLKKANFSTVPHARELFDTLNTQDLEAVIRLLVRYGKSATELRRMPTLIYSHKLRRMQLQLWQSWLTQLLKITRTALLM